MRRLISVALGLACAGGCLLSPEGGLTLQVLLDQRARWQALGLTDYDYEFQRSCFCPVELTGPTRIEVRGGLMTGAFDAFTGDTLAPNALWWPTIDSIFARIERDMRNDYQVQITYDPSHFFPAQAVGDRASTVDEEYVQTAGKLTVVPK